MLLIITNKQDFTADYFITHLIDHGKKYFRLNSEELNQAEILFSQTNDESSRQVSISGKVLDLDTVTCVWYRRKIYVMPSDVIVPEQRRYVVGEVTHLVEGLINKPELLWVNPIAAVEAAERKVYQLRLAHELGFAVPDTVISNNPARVRQFYSQHRNRVICKPIFHGLYIANESRYAVYTRKVDEADLQSNDQIRSCPVYLQQEITKGTDIRVTVIGDEIFPVEIFSNGKPPLDWRRVNEKVKYRSCSIDNALVDLCRALLKKLNLVYGAFDFVRSDTGQYVFLELNPTGEWAWLEKELRLPMREAFVRLFKI